MKTAMSTKSSLTAGVIHQEEGSPFYYTPLPRNRTQDWCSLPVTRSQEDINLDKKVERDMIDRDMCGHWADTT